MLAMPKIGLTFLLIKIYAEQMTDKNNKQIELRFRNRENAKIPLIM